jgi:signal transduction histidine kinase
MLHTRAGALRGQAWKRTVHQDDRAAAQAASERSMKEGKAEFEATAVCADGSHFFAQVLMVRRDEDGRPAGHYCFMRDITDRKQAQIHLQLLQQVTEAISASPDLASAMSVALDRIRETTGWAFAEVWAADAGSDSLEYLCASYDPEPAFESFAASSMTMTVKRGQGLPGRVWSATEPELIANIREAPPGTFLRADTAARAGFTAAFAVPIVADGEVMAILVFFMRDPRKPHLKLVLDLVATVASQLGSVVRRKRVDEALKWANAELAHRNEHMNEFLYSISHDLKAPLVSIGGIAALLQEAMKDGDADGAEDLLETLERTTGTMHSTIDDLLELARSGSVSGKPEPVDLAEFVRDALARLDPVFRAKGFEVEVAGDLPRVSVDRDGFARVLDNILLNAIKYAADVPAPRIEIGARTSVEEHRLYIADNGPGIEPQHHERIFKPFQRLDSSREGTGIGLAIVRRIMAAHGGRAWVESETGSGTTFWLALPTRPPATVAIA